MRKTVVFLTICALMIFTIGTVDAWADCSTPLQFGNNDGTGCSCIYQQSAYAETTCHSYIDVYVSSDYYYIKDYATPSATAATKTDSKGALGSVRVTFSCGVNDISNYISSFHRIFTSGLSGASDTTEAHYIH